MPLNYHSFFFFFEIIKVIMVGMFHIECMFPASEYRDPVSHGIYVHLFFSRVQSLCVWSPCENDHFQENYE